VSRDSIDIIVVAEQGNRARRDELSTTDIADALCSAGYSVRSVTILDLDTGLTGSYRSDKQARIDVKERREGGSQ